MNRREMLAALGGGSAMLAALPLDQLWAATHQLRREPGLPLGPFSPHQAETIARIADLILPRTDTPGAIDAKVPEFIALIVDQWDLPEDKALMMAGLEDVDARSRGLGGESFIALREQQQIGLLTTLDSELQALKARNEPTEKNFFQRIKELTLYGYYTSEIGMKQELEYSVIPGRYDACFPVQPR